MDARPLTDVVIDIASLDTSEVTLVYKMVFSKNVTLLCKINF
jgi:hypothetical protein